MIDINLYPKHDWFIYYHDGFQSLRCDICKMYICERYSGHTKYIRVSSNVDENIWYEHEYDLNIIRRQLLTCEENIIKNIIE